METGLSVILKDIRNGRGGILDATDGQVFYESFTKPRRSRLGKQKAKRNRKWWEIQITGL